MRNIKPLYPTYWLVHLSALQSAIRQYKTILESLAETSECSTEVRMRATGLRNKFQDRNVLKCLVMATKVVKLLECLNRALQSNSTTISSMLIAENHVKDQLLSLRTMTEVKKRINYLQLDSLKTSRAKKTPARLSGPADAYNPPTVE